MKHIHGILAALAVGLLSLGLIEYSIEYPSDDFKYHIIAGLFAICIGLTVELICLLFIERGETRAKIAGIETLQNQAAPKFEEAKTEAKNIQRYVSSLEEHVSSLEQEI